MTTTTPETDAEKTVESPAEQENESFGSWLRRQRELREISLREIADTSKISLRYLQALEDDRFDILPAPVFAKGFLRQYARYVGLDPEEAVNFYQDAHGLSSGDDKIDPATQRAGGTTPWSYAMIVIGIAILLMAVVWTLVWFNRQATDTPVPATTQGQQAAGPETTSFEPVSSERGSLETASLETGSIETASIETGSIETASDGPEDEDSVPDPSTGFFVTIDFRGDCWVRATVDGETREDRVYTQGESLPLEAQQVVDLELGNIFEVEVEVDGHPMSLTNESKNPVQRLHIDLETVAALAQSGV